MSTVRFLSWFCAVQMYWPESFPVTMLMKRVAAPVPLVMLVLEPSLVQMRTVWGKPSKQQVRFRVSPSLRVFSPLICNFFTSATRYQENYWTNLNKIKHFTKFSLELDLVHKSLFKKSNARKRAKSKIAWNNNQIIEILKEKSFNWASETVKRKVK